MNIDIRLSLGFFDHPKTKKLVRRLGWEAVICLQRLWMWAAENRPSGRFSGMDAEDLELAACWDGEEGKFVQTLLDLRWLEHSDEGYALHDWEENQAYASRSEDRRIAARKAADARWAKERAKGNAEDMPTDAERMGGDQQGQCGSHADVCEAHTKGNAPETRNQLINTPHSLLRESTPQGGAPAPVRDKQKSAPFSRKPPTVEEVQAYCDARGNGIDAAAFVDFYASKGWKVGASPMKDWRAAVRTWEARHREKGASRRAPAREENNGEAVRRAVERMAGAAAFEEGSW